MSLNQSSANDSSAFTQYLYAVKDVRRQGHLSVFVEVNDDVAKRAFSMSLNSADAFLAPDLQLWRLGRIDEQGVLAPLPPLHLTV